MSENIKRAKAVVDYINDMEKRCLTLNVFEEGIRKLLSDIIDDVVKPFIDAGWIPWGGSTEYPVDPRTPVDVLLRNGTQLSDPACAFTWFHDNTDGDIVGYRVRA